MKPFVEGQRVLYGGRASTVIQCRPMKPRWFPAYWQVHARLDGPNDNGVFAAARHFEADARALARWTREGGMSDQRYDVVAVTIARPCTVRLLDEGKTEQNAEAVVRTAVYRRGVETEFYAVVPAGQYKEGDLYQGVGSLPL